MTQGKAMKQSETPLTDGEADHVDNWHNDAITAKHFQRKAVVMLVSADFARKLELQNNELRAKLAESESRYEISHTERLRITRLYNDKDLCEHGSAPCQYALELIQRAESAEAAAAKAREDAERKRSVWLLERGQRLHHDPTIWFVSRITGHDRWTEVAHEAQRFNSREDAEREADMLFGRLPNDWRERVDVTEHVFLDAALRGGKDT